MTPLPNGRATAPSQQTAIAVSGAPEFRSTVRAEVICNPGLNLGPAARGRRGVTSHRVLHGRDCTLGEVVECDRLRERHVSTDVLITQDLRALFSVHFSGGVEHG